MPAFGNDFKKPLWYDEESDDELFDNNKVFGFQVFSNPMEIQKYHEQQMQRMLKTFEQFEGGLNDVLMISFIFAFNLSAALIYLLYFDPIWIKESIFIRFTTEKFFIICLT